MLNQNYNGGNVPTHPNSKPSVSYQESSIIKDLLFEYEYKVLYSLNFDTNVKLPQKVVGKYKREIIEMLSHQFLNEQKLITTLCFYVNDSFLTPVCFKYSNEVIAFSCLKVLSSNLNLTPDFSNFFKKHSELPLGFKKDIEECSSFLSEMFRKLKNLGKNNSHLNHSGKQKERIYCFKMFNNQNIEIEP